MTAGTTAQPIASLSDAMRAALAHEHAGHSAQAEALYRQIVAVAPTHHPAWHALGLLAVNSGRLPLALQCLERAVAHAPENGLYLRNLTELYRRNGQWQQAIAIGERAVTCAPDDPAAHYNLGLALANVGRVDDAISRYRKVLQLQPKHALAWNNLGSALEQKGDRAAAATAYTEAIANDSRHAEALNNLGALESIEGKLDDARAHFEAALRIRPDFVEAHHNLSSLKTYRPDDPQLAQLRDLQQRRQHMPMATRIRYNFTLGKALDDCGDYEAAFACYAEGNQLQHTLLPINEEASDAFFAQIIQAFTAEFFAQRNHWNQQNGRKASTETLRRPVFIVGMPRSGTTLLEQILCSHPDLHGAGELPDLHEAVVAAVGQPPQPFTMAALTQSQLYQLGEEYRSRLWRHSPSSQYISDKMLGNFVYLGLIHLALPEARIIHIRRDPMDTCLSCFTQLFRTGMEFSYDLDSLGHYYQRYHRLMEHWRAVLPPGTMLEVDYEALVGDTETEARRLLEFVGLPWHDDCVQFHRNPRPVHTASIAQVRQPVYRGSVGKWQRFARHLQPLYARVKDLRPPNAVEPAVPCDAPIVRTPEETPALSIEQHLQQILHSRPNHAEALHLLAVIKHHAGATPSALDLMAQAVAAAPNNALFHSNRGEMCRLAGRIDEAIAHGEAAIKCAPDLAAAHSNLGIAWHDKGELDRAEACHQRALALQPQLLQSLNNLGSIQRKRGNLIAAADGYRRALAAQPDFVEALSNLGAVLVENDQAQEAITPLQRALQLQPNHPEALCNLGLAHLILENQQIAGGFFQKALQHRPSYPEALTGLARALHSEDRPDQVEALLRQALTLAADNAETWCHLGTVLMEQARSTEAEAAYQQALTLDAELVEAHVGLANLRLEQGQADEAEALLLHALAQQPDHIGAHFHLIQARKVTADNLDLGPLEAALANAENLNTEKRISLHFALGKAYDDLKRTDDAFPQFLTGARLKRAKLHYDADEEERRTQRIIDTLDGALLERLRGWGDPSEQPVFVLGMPRSGTTLTEQIIASHPQVHGAGELKDLMQVLQQTQAGRQPLLYPDHLAKVTPAELTRWGGEYSQRLRRHAPDVLRITDKMPGNYLALGVIPLLLPNARIIHVQRNPVDTCLSCFTRLFNRHQDATYDLAELGRHYVNYARLMEHWREVLPADSFLDVQYEDIVADTEAQARRLIDWVGLAWDDRCLAFHQNTRRVRTASLAQVRQPIYTGSVERWRPYAPYLGPLLDALGDYGPGSATSAHES